MTPVKSRRHKLSTEDIKQTSLAYSLHHVTNSYTGAFPKSASDKGKLEKYLRAALTHFVSDASLLVLAYESRGLGINGRSEVVSVTVLKPGSADVRRLMVAE